jgi:hypothetical protein
VVRAGKHIVPAIALGVVTVAVLLLVRSLQQTGDSLTYAISVQTGEQLFHPHHLLFSPIVRIFYLALSAVAPSADAILAGQVHNALWAAAGVVGMYWVVLRLSGSTPIGIGAAGMLLGAQGYLKYSSQVEVYVAATACLILLVALLVEKWPEPSEPSRDWIVSLLLGASVLYHQTNVLFCLPLAVFFLWSGRSAGIVRSVRIIGLAGGGVLAIYVAAYYFTKDSPHSLFGFIDFCMRYAVTERPWGSWEHYGSRGVTALFRSQLWDWLLVPASWQSRAVGAFAGTLGATVLWNAIRAFGLGRSGRLRALLIVWLITFYGFFLWWQPGQREFYVITLVPVLLLFFTTLIDLPLFNKRGVALATIGVALAVVSLAVLLPRHLMSTMLPLHRGFGPYYTVAEEYEAVRPEGCVLLATRMVSLHVRYYFGGDLESTRNVGMPRRFLDETGAVREQEPLPIDRCVMVSLVDILVVRDEAKGTPVEQLAFLRWLFRLEPDASDRSIRGPVVTRLVDPAGRTFLMRNGQRETFSGMLDFCRAIDQVSGHKRSPGPLESWFLDRRDRLVEAGVEPLFTAIERAP